VQDWDADVIFLDQNFGSFLDFMNTNAHIGTVHDSLRGTDILRTIRAADEASKVSFILVLMLI
jgi:hypothetical protein